MYKSSKCGVCKGKGLFQAMMIQGCLYIPLLHTPWGNEPKQLPPFIPLSPKGVYAPFKVAWKPGKPRGMNKGYVLPPEMSDPQTPRLTTCQAALPGPPPRQQLQQLPAKPLAARNSISAPEVIAQLCAEVSGSGVFGWPVRGRTSAAAGPKAQQKSSEVCSWTGPLRFGLVCQLPAAGLLAFPRRRPCAFSPPGKMRTYAW